MDLVTLQLAKKYTAETMAGAGAIKGDKGDPGPQGPAGPKGDTGKQGQDGATFTPAVSEDGTLSWTNNGGLPNPEPANIKGPPGGGEGGTSDHRSLTNRDAANQHPIDSITGLSEALEKTMTKGNALTEAEILDIMEVH